MTEPASEMSPAVQVVLTALNVFQAVFIAWLARSRTRADFHRQEFEEAVRKHLGIKEPEGSWTKRRRGNGKE